jgi:hypothetical protein
VLRVSPAEFLRILGNVMALESERFPPEILQHMQATEQQLLESSCWASGSCLLEVFEKLQPQQIRAIAHWVAPSPAAKQLYAQSTPTTPAITTAATELPIQVPRSLLVPLRKLLAMCARRLPELAGDTEPMLVREAWDILVYVLSEHGAAVMCDNHALVLVLCAVYAV